MGQSSKFKILWVDDDPGVLAAAQRFLRYQPWELVVVDSALKAKEELSHQVFSVLIADQRMPHETGIDLLKYAEETSPTTSRILLTGFLEKDVAASAVNRSKVFRFISKPWNEEELLADIEKAIDFSVATISEKKLIREVSEQNKKLENLTSGLEQLVEDRTFHIENSKNQMERNLAKMRRLVLFIKELSGLRGLDELLILVKKEIKPFHETGDPVLAYQTHDERRKILYFSRREVTESKVEEPWSDGNRIRVNSLEDQRYLSHQFSRPFAKTVAIPIQRKGWTKRGMPAVLFIENDLPAEKMDFFVEFISQRIQPIAISVDRILLEYQARFVSYQWESTFDGIESPIAIVDESYNLLRSNQNFSKGRKAQSCHIQFAGGDKTCVGCPVEKSIRTGEPSVGKVHSEGRIYNVFSYPIHLSEGEKDSGSAAHVINYYVDITKSKRLYGQVIQNEKLGAIGLLAGNIAHELNNPLTGIRSLAQVIGAELKGDGVSSGKNSGKNPDPWQIRDDILEVEKAAERSQTIIKNLLDFSNPDEAENLMTVDLNEIVDKTLPLLKTAMRNFRTDVQLCETSGFVRVKMPLLQQVFFNLVNNACQAMCDKGEITIETSIRDSSAVLKVTDTGPGIEESVLEHIFEPFFTTKEEGVGTGLGLSISSSIVEKFGGRLEVESQLGRGTSFSVHLPLVETEVETELEVE